MLWQLSFKRVATAMTRLANEQKTLLKYHTYD
jgi:hypothetical protein